MDMRRDESNEPTRANPAGALTRRYLAALAAVAALLLLNQLGVQPPLLRLAADAPVLNLSGRQRMLSQRLTKAALLIDRAETRADRRERNAELAGVLALWEAAHDRLRSGRVEVNSVEVREAFDGLQPSFTRMRDAAARMIRGGGRDDLAAILQVEGDYLARMDRIVGIYEREARARVDALRRTGWAVTALILVALLGLGLTVLLPASRLIRRQFAELGEARDALEDRVRRRTIELERAYEDLAREVAGRSAAEGRSLSLLEQFSHVSRTTTIGEMASGLAHELNQPLGAIANYTEGCLVALEAPAPDLAEIRVVLDRVLAATLRAGQIIASIRKFVTRHAAASEPFAPNRVAEEVEALFRDEAARRGIALELELAPDLPSLLGDPVQIQQVVVNLVRNAFESLAAAKVVEPRVLMKTRPGPAGGAEWLVIDNGEGIPTARIATVFDAFFSTRAEGMGMGLAISRTIVEAHHGRIDVESVPGVRTAFRFSIPPPSGGGDDDQGTDGHHRRR